MQYDSRNLVIHPGASKEEGVLVEVTPELAGWELIHFQARQMPVGTTWSFETGGHELALVMLGGKVRVDSNRGVWNTIGHRTNVFEGLPHALYLPRDTVFSILAVTDCEYGVAWAKTDEEYPPRHIIPDEISVEIRGGDNATRQINSIIPPGFDCHRLVVVEVYTPSGGWSSYPPHKHDLHKVNEAGRLLEADLEEIYYYKIDKPDGYAFQRIYTDPESPLHQAGYPIDVVVMAQENDVVLVPEGYHPVVSPPGYTTYYLNVLAGSAQALSSTDDPRYSWVKEQYASRNTAVPVYS